MSNLCSWNQRLPLSEAGALCNEGQLRSQLAWRFCSKKLLLPVHRWSDASSSVLVNRLSIMRWGGRSLICGMCLFPWCKYSHHSRFHVTSDLTTGFQNSCNFPVHITADFSMPNLFFPSPEARLYSDSLHPLYLCLQFTLKMAKCPAQGQLPLELGTPFLWQSLLALTPARHQQVFLELNCPPCHFLLQDTCPWWDGLYIWPVWLFLHYYIILRPPQYWGPWTWCWGYSKNKNLPSRALWESWEKWKNGNAWEGYLLLLL